MCTSLYVKPAACLLVWQISKALKEHGLALNSESVMFDVGAGNMSPVHFWMAVSTGGGRGGSRGGAFVEGEGGADDRSMCC